MHNSTKVVSQLKTEVPLRYHVSALVAAALVALIPTPVLVRGGMTNSELVDCGAAAGRDNIIVVL